MKIKPLARPKNPVEWAKIEKNQMERLIYQETGHYFVWIDKQLDVDWRTTDRHSQNEEKEHNFICNQVADLESMPLESLDKPIIINFKRMLGESLARSLGNDNQGAKYILDKARAYIEARSLEKSKIWYSCYATLFAIPVATVLLVTWTAKEMTMLFWGQSAPFVFLAGGAGAIGALFSIYIRQGKSVTDSRSGEMTHAIEAGSRILAGTLSGAFIWLAARTGLVTSLLTTSASIPLAVCVLGVASGMTERWVPSIIEKVVKNRSNVKNAKNSGDDL